MSLKLGSLDLGKGPACGRKLFPAAYIIRDGHRFHPECSPEASAPRHERQLDPPAAARAS